MGIGAILAEKDRFTPEHGFNLVGRDDFEPAGEQLYLVGHFPRREDAEAAMAARLAENPDEALYIYGAA